jgi:hypothetical protein
MKKRERGFLWGGGTEAEMRGGCYAPTSLVSLTRPGSFPHACPAVERLLRCGQSDKHSDKR